MTILSPVKGKIPTDSCELHDSGLATVPIGTQKTRTGESRSRKRGKKTEMEKVYIAPSVGDNLTKPRRNQCGAGAGGQLGLG
eukprot:767257-Hanusia_phi.AAC.10